MLDKTSTKILLIIVLLLLYSNSVAVYKRFSFEIKEENQLKNPCPNCCFTNPEQPPQREAEEDEKILVPLFDIDNENQILGMREAIFFAKQLKRADFKGNFRSEILSKFIHNFR